MNTKLIKSMAAAGFLGSILTISNLAGAADAAKSNDPKKAKPYPLKTCIVSDEKLDGDMGKPYVFVEQGQEIKLCCKDCLKDFKKDPAKYLKKLEEAKKAPKGTTPSAPAHDHGHQQH